MAQPQRVRAGATGGFGRRVGVAALALGLVLTVCSFGYGWERDELYFTMLRPSWGYVDQPPLVPLLAHGLVSVVDAVWFVRLPATIAAMATVVVVAQLCREFGGSRRSAIWTAWLTAGTSAVLGFGHVLLTNVFDLLVWTSICLLVVRAQLRRRPQLWTAAGAVAGLATSIKWLVVWLLAALLVGIAVAGPRRLLRDRHVLLGGLLAIVLSTPNLLYQATHGWPQLQMGDALAAKNAGQVRVMVWVLLLAMPGPVLAVVCGAGLWDLWRRTVWRPVRFLAPAVVVVVVATFVAGAQPTYPIPLLLVLLAAGMATHGERLLGSRVMCALLAVNAAIGALISLPLIPASWLHDTPIPAMNVVVADQIGWPAYVSDVEAAAGRVPAQARHTTVVITSNYGEAGALARLGRGLPPVYSGHNALGRLPGPPESTSTVIWVGAQATKATRWFAHCTIVGRLDNKLGVANEEQHKPIAICVGPRQPWQVIWPQMRHLD